MFEKLLSVCADLGNWAARNGGFVISLIGLFIAMDLAFAHDADINTLLPTLVGLYLTHSATRAVSAHINSSKDENCDTAQVIREVEGLSAPKKES